MANPPITCSNLVATAGTGGILLTWDVTDSNLLPYCKLAIVEIWAASSNNRGVATKIGEGYKFFVHSGLSAGATRYYWVRSKNVAGYYGDFFPASATAGINATVLHVTASGINVSNLGSISQALGTIVTGTLGAAVVYAGTINANQINASSLSAISANLGTITAGDITGVTMTASVFQTALEGTGERIVILYNSPAMFGYNASNVLSLVLSPRDGFLLTVSTASPVAEITNSGGSGGVAIAGRSISGFAFYDLGGGYGPFTGCHDGFMRKDIEAEVGDVLVDRRIVASRGVSDVVTEVAPCDQPNLRNAIGVLVTRLELTAKSKLAAGLGDDAEGLIEAFDRVKVNSVGEGKINVCGVGGPIEVGDLLVTSGVPGKAMRQDDDVLRSCTVARAREAVDVRTPNDVAQIACIYLCG